MYPKVINKLIEDFKKLPSIGEKSAERLVLHIASKWDEETIKEFGNDLLDLKKNIRYCKKCHMLAEGEFCTICEDSKRDQKLLMVVADIKDEIVIEKTGIFNGLYHILGGLIDFSRGITDKDLNIETLIKRLDDIDEIILATDGTVEGEITAKFLKNLLVRDGLKISRLAYGLAVGMDIKYADELTLAKAVNNRQKY